MVAASRESPRLHIDGGVHLGASASRRGLLARARRATLDVERLEKGRDKRDENNLVRKLPPKEHTRASCDDIFCENADFG